MASLNLGQTALPSRCSLFFSTQDQLQTVLFVLFSVVKKGQKCTSARPLASEREAAGSRVRFLLLARSRLHQPPCFLSRLLHCPSVLCPSLQRWDSEHLQLLWSPAGLGQDPLLAVFSPGWLGWLQAELNLTCASRLSHLLQSRTVFTSIILQQIWMMARTSLERIWLFNCSAKSYTYVI